MIHESYPGLSRYIAEGDKVERIYRVVLSVKENDRTWYRIAKDAGVSYGWAHSVLKGLEKEGMIDGSKVIDPKRLFMKWAQRKDQRLFREYNIQEPERAIDAAGLEYAYTGYYAENQLGRYLFPTYRELYVKKDDAEKWHRAMIESGYVGKGNVQVLLADEHVFFEMQRVDGRPLVSTQQLIVDLYRTGAECAEAADILLSRAYR